VAARTSAPKKRGKHDPAARRARLRPVALGLTGIGVVLLVAALIAFRTLHLRPSAPPLAGAILNPPAAAPDFRLPDQFGQQVRLSSFRGKSVVLTFLYTNCPDACPLITEKLHQAHAMLGPDVDRAAFLAVTVDPAHDTVDQVRAYSEKKDMLQKWHFLVGPEATLKPIWAAYGVSSESEDAIAQQAQATAVAVGAPTPTPSSTNLVEHTSPIFVIDPSGQIRAILDIDAPPSDVVQDIRALLP
jgi:protein SCO1